MALAIPEFLIAGIVFIALALVLMIRVAVGPTAVDRAVAAESVDSLVIASLVMFTVVSGRNIFLDVAIVMALLGFIGLAFISKYLEGSL